MRKLEKTALLVLAGISISILAAGTASAETTMSCRNFARLAALDWAQDYIAPAADAEKANHNQVVVIAAGQKYFVPKRQPDDLNLHLIPVGQRAIEINNVYNEELDRCLGAQTITINVVK